MKILHVFTLASTAEAFFDGQFKYLTDKGQDITLACSENSTILDFAIQNNISYIPIEIPRTLSPTSDIRAIRQLVRWIKRQKYDIVVGHTPKGALLAMIAAKIAGCKKRVYLRHGLIYTTASGVKRTILKTEERFVSSMATNIINVSPSLGNVAVKDKLNLAKKQTIIGKGTCGGIDTTDKFNPDIIDKNRLSALKFSQKISESDYVIGFCGRLCKDKGIPELIEGFQLFRKQNPGIKSKLLLVGGYDSRDILPDSIHAIIDSDADIIHVGRILKDIQYYYSLMDVFVFPSHREGFGMCSIEAQAMCVPTLVPKTHGCVDTIVSDVTGLYIDLTPQSISEKLLTLHDKNKRMSMGVKARKFVCENFERTMLWPQILDYYYRLYSTKNESL